MYSVYCGDCLFAAFLEYSQAAVLKVRLDAMFRHFGLSDISVSILGGVKDA